MASWNFRRVHPSRPKAMICCFFSSFKTFAMLREAKYPPALVNVLDASSESMAAFQVFMYGRFWVFTEVVERVLVLTPGAPQSTTGIRIAVAGLPSVVSCSGPDTIRCEAAQANRWLKCQPSSYVRLEAYGFFGLSEGA